jgi:dihydrofolate reductase
VTVTCRLSISLDGYTAGPNQSLKDPFGVEGARLNDWMFETDQSGREQDADILAEATGGIGAHIMGRRMFGGGGGEWNTDWRGWWGEEPPYHAPVFVLTHHPRQPLSMEGGTTFNFVTEGIQSALVQAKEASGGQDIAIAGGASTVRQYLNAGLLDEIYLHVVPVILGAGERLLDGVENVTFKPVKVVASPTVTHVKYRVTTR